MTYLYITACIAFLAMILHNFSLNLLLNYLCNYYSSFFLLSTLMPDIQLFGWKVSDIHLSVCCMLFTFSTSSSEPIHAQSPHHKYSSRVSEEVWLLVTSWLTWPRHFLLLIRTIAVEVTRLVRNGPLEILKKYCCFSEWYKVKDHLPDLW